MDPSPSRNCGGFRSIRHPPTIAPCQRKGAVRRKPDRSLRAVPWETGDARRASPHVYQLSLLWTLL